MNLIQARVLGIVQGLTEFIPVSSSAHLVLVPWLLGWTFEPQTAFAFNVLVQLGTLLAVIVYFWRDGVSLLSAAIGALRTRRWAEGRLAWPLILARLAAAAAGARDLVEELKPADSLIIGRAQALALFPGISRSGWTIAAGLARGLTRPQAARFSFLMSLS